MQEQWITEGYTIDKEQYAKIREDNEELDSAVRFID